MSNLQKIKEIINLNPCFESNNGVFYCGDSIEILKKFTDITFDLTLTDLPYGINVRYDNYEDSEKNLCKIIKNIMPILTKISKRIALTPGINNITKYPKSDWMLVWIYKGGANKSKWGFNCYQPILVYGPDPYIEKHLGCYSDVIHYEETPPRNTLHPCPKPVNFWTRLLKRCSVSETDIILDPFAGSGTTAIACEKLNRQWVCIELSEKYCEEAVNRLKIHEAQGVLF